MYDTKNRINSYEDMKQKGQIKRWTFTRVFHVFSTTINLQVTDILVQSRFFFYICLKANLTEGQILLKSLTLLLNEHL